MRLTLSVLGEKFSSRHFEIFYIFLIHVFTCIIKLANGFHEISKPTSLSDKADFFFFFFFIFVVVVV